MFWKRIRHPPTRSWNRSNQLVLHHPSWGKFVKKKMASASLHGDRSYLVSRGKKTPSPLVQGSKTPIPRTSEAKKRLNSSDGSSKQLVSAAKVPTSGCKSAAQQRPSDILNPKTVDPVSIFCSSCCTFR